MPLEIAPKWFPRAAGTTCCWRPRPSGSRQQPGAESCWRSHRSGSREQLGAERAPLEIAPK
eukprot:7715295-Alexandrium_andersonii.AAC.1